MTTLALKDVAVILDPKRFFNPPGKPNEAYPSITFGDGALTYDTYGIPVPPPGDFGMLNEILRILIQAPPDGYQYVYDPTVRTANPVAPYGTIRIFQVAADPGAPSIAAASAGTPAGSVAAPAFTGTPISPGTPAGTVDPSTHVFTGAAMGNITPAGGNSAPAFTGSAMATHTHALTGGSGVAAPMTELGAVAVAATVLPLIVIGQ